jgi:hypothetical protein
MTIFQNEISIRLNLYNDFHVILPGEPVVSLKVQ